MHELMPPSESEAAFSVILILTKIQKKLKITEIYYVNIAWLQYKQIDNFRLFRV